MFDKNLNNKTGFTLPEMLVAIGVVSVIAAVSVVFLGNVRIKARDAKRMADLEQISSALELYNIANGSYPLNITPGEPLQLPNGKMIYLSKVPSNPTPRNDGECQDNEYYYSVPPAIEGSDDTADYKPSFFVISTCLGIKNEFSSNTGVISYSPNGLFLCGSKMIDSKGNEYETNVNGQGVCVVVRSLSKLDNLVLYDSLTDDVIQFTSVDGSPFNPDIYSYDASALNRVKAVKVSPTGAGEIKVNGTIVNSGDKSSERELVVGENTNVMEIEVKQTGKARNWYRISVFRNNVNQATPTFSNPPNGICLEQEDPITITSSNAEHIYYAIVVNGNEPWQDCPLPGLTGQCNLAMPLSSSLVIKSYATRVGYDDSEIAQKVYNLCPAPNLTNLEIEAVPAARKFIFKSDVYEYNRDIDNSIIPVTVQNDVPSIRLRSTINPEVAGVTIRVYGDGSEVPSGEWSQGIIIPDPVEDPTLGIEEIRVVITKAKRKDTVYTLYVKRRNVQAEPTFNPDPTDGPIISGTTVQLNSVGAENIYYTTDGSDPIPNVSPSVETDGDPVINFSGGTTKVDLKVIAVRDNYDDSDIVTASYEQAVQTTPSFSVPAGAIAWGTSVSISSLDADNIYYTTDGSTPTESEDLKYSGPITINGASCTLNVSGVCTVKALAVRSRYANSQIAVVQYTQATSDNLKDISLSGPPYNFTFNEGVYTYNNVSSPSNVSSITVTPTSGGDGEIRVLDELEGSDEVVNSGDPSSPISLTAGVEKNIKIIFTQTGKKPRTYNINITRNGGVQATPTFNPGSGAVTWGTEVTISSTGADMIYYTTDGSTPTTSSINQEEVPLVINSAVTVRAIAIRSGYDVSAIASATYTQAASSNLSNIVLSGSPANYTFASGTYTYEGVTVLNAVASITVTPTGSGTITVEGVTVASGSASAAISLTPGVTKDITIITTEVGKSPKTYRINVTRNYPAQTTPTFNPGAGAVAWGTTVVISSPGASRIHYTTDGSTPTTSSPDQEDAPLVINSAVTVRALAVRAGYDNSAIGSASYTQAASANLTGITLSGPPANYTFNAAVYTYNGVVISSTVQSITVRPSGAGVITVQGVVVASGTESSAINLSPGIEKTILVVATETGKSPKTYTIRVTRTGLSVGLDYQGGRIAYILQPADPGYSSYGQQGFIAATVDQAGGFAPWGCEGTFITGADGTAIGTGSQNTTDIINGCATGGIAARLARDYRGGGYTDWYLPSKDEAYKVFLNRGVIGGFPGTYPYTYGYYATSSEVNRDANWTQNFDSAGDMFPYAKSAGYYVRAIRSFSEVINGPVTGIGPITGTAKVGYTLTAGVISPSRATVNYQWLSATSSGGPYTNISGATSNTYTPVSGDYGKFIKVSATGTGDFTGTVISAATSAIVFVAIGDSYQGGKVAYIDGTGLHGLIAASNDQSGQTWSNVQNTLAGTSTAMGTGSTNTRAITRQTGHSYSAAKICDDYVDPTFIYTDWYLPSKDEIAYVSTNRALLGIFVAGYYAVSSEFNSNTVWVQNFDGYAQFTYGKDFYYNIRCIRTF